MFHPSPTYDVKPYYGTRLGLAYLGDALELLKMVPDESVNLIMTSPPFALTCKKDYGNPPADAYVEWFMRFVDEFKRVLAWDGSMVIHVGGSWVRGEPRKSLYNFELLIELSKELVFIQDFYCYNPAQLPAPAEWVCRRRVSGLRTPWTLYGGSPRLTARRQTTGVS